MLKLQVHLLVNDASWTSIMSSEEARGLLYIFHIFPTTQMKCEEPLPHSDIGNSEANPKNKQDKPSSLLSLYIFSCCLQIDTQKHLSERHKTRTNVHIFFSKNFHFIYVSYKQILSLLTISKVSGLCQCFEEVECTVLKCVIIILYC